MRGTCASLVGLTLLLGCDSSRKKPTPEPAKAVEASAPARDAGAARDGGASGDAGLAPAPAPDPIAAGLERVHRPGETLPDPMRRRIRSRLQASSKVPIALHHIIDVPRPDGGREVFALWESSVYEQCLTEWRTPDERREHCLGQLANVVDHTLDWNGGPGPKYAHKDIRLNQHCVTLGAVHAVFGPAGPKDPADTGGALEVTSLALPDLRCVVRRYHRVLVADLDGDKQLEMYLDLTTANEQVGEVRGDFTDSKTVKQYATAERMYILSGDVTAIQVALDLGEGTFQADDSANGVDGPPDAESIALIDADRDGHRDVLEIKPCFKDMLPIGAPGPPPCDVEPHETVVHRYDPAADRYLDGAPGRNFAEQLHGRAMKALAARRAETAVQLWRDAAVIDPTWSWPPYNLACQAALAGRNGDAFAQLRLLALRSPDLDLVHRLDTDPDLAALRKIAAFDDVESDIVRAVLSKLSLSPAGDAPGGKLAFSNEGEAAFSYTCSDCTAATAGTYRYTVGKLDLAAGESRASYELQIKSEQLCFARVDRARTAGSGSDDTAPPLPDSCWVVR